uniref:40S ribosomal protein S15 n=1 Tax=Syphacia muris TaxID=451379 RepID=A0A0N5AKY1_9BILA
MSVFKKFKRSKECKAATNGIPEREVQRLDRRMGLDTYRDFFTLKNYWKAIDRKRSDAAVFLLLRLVPLQAF